MLVWIILELALGLFAWSSDARSPEPRQDATVISGAPAPSDTAHPA
jgi:hypothetical protein